MNKEDFLDFLFCLMDLKSYGKMFFHNKFDVEIWKGDNSIKKTVRVTIKTQTYITKNLEYFRAINKIFEGFSVDYTLEEGEISFTLNNLKWEKISD